MGKRNRRDYKKGEEGETDEGKKAKAVELEDDNPSVIIKAFRQHQKDLDTKHDKYERLVKLSRDVTIDSKRTIFLLHRITGQEDKKNEILEESAEKLKTIQQSKWKAIAQELKNEDPFQYIRAFSPGLQEYVEALSFHYYLNHKSLISLKQVEETLVFPASADSTQSQTNSEGSGDKKSATEEVKSGEGNVETKEASKEGDHNKEVAATPEFSIHIPPMEYMLGLADLTGELMRMAIGSVGKGDLDLPFELCSFLRVIYDAFVSYGNIARELSRKLFVLRQSLEKVETACYTLQVRGSEIPKNMLADIFSSPSGPHDSDRFGDMTVNMDG